MELNQNVQASITFNKSGEYKVSCDETFIYEKFKASRYFCKKIITELNQLVCFLNSSQYYITLYFEFYNNEEIYLMKDDSYMEFMAPSLMRHLKIVGDVVLTNLNIFNSYNIIIEYLLLNKFIKEIY